MNTDENDELWQLLGQAKQPTVSPFFARNVLREVRGLRRERAGWLGWLADHWKVPTLATACAAVALAGGLHLMQQRGEAEDGQLLAMAQTVSESPDYHVIGHLDELLDSEENSIWLAESN